MLNRRTPLRLFTLLAFTVALSAVAHAQATRTWVSGVGDDVNPCSRTAPCKTFAGAISKTADSGEIDCLDPGGFGTVTITKSLTIDGTKGAGFGSILAAGTNGVNVNDSATVTPRTIIVTLRNLSINGAATGFDGIRFISGRKLYVEGCTVFNFRGNGTNSDGLDIAINPGDAGTFNVNVKNSIFENCTGDAIRMALTAAHSTPPYDNVVLAGSNNGLEVTGGTANISNSIIDGNTVNGLICPRTALSSTPAATRSPRTRHRRHQLRCDRPPEQQRHLQKRHRPRQARAPTTVSATITSWATRATA